MTAAAVFAQLKQQISQNMILLVQHIAKKVTVLRRNIIFCDICCFSCSNIAAAVIALTQCCKLASFFTFIFAVFVCFCAVHLSHKSKILSMWERLGVILGIFLLHMRRNDHISTSGQKSYVTIISADPNFL